MKKNIAVFFLLVVTWQWSAVAKVYPSIPYSWVAERMEQKVPVEFGDINLKNFHAAGTRVSFRIHNTLYKFEAFYDGKSESVVIKMNDMTFTANELKNFSVAKQSLLMKIRAKKAQQFSWWDLFVPKAFGVGNPSGVDAIDAGYKNAQGSNGNLGQTFDFSLRYGHVERGATYQRMGAVLKEEFSMRGNFLALFLTGMSSLVNNPMFGAFLQTPAALPLPNFTAM